MGKDANLEADMNLVPVVIIQCQLLLYMQTRSTGVCMQ